MRSSTELPATDQERPPDQQKDYLCGPFHAARLLREAGVLEWEGWPVDQDLVALHAGTSLPEDPASSEVPPGARSLRDYRYELPRVPAAWSGTPAPGLAAAIEELSGGDLVSLPLSGDWTGAVVEALLGGVATSEVWLIANLRTGLLWGSRPPLEAVLSALDGARLTDPPAADWDVGHFVELAQLLRGRAGALVVVRDSYPSFGWGGVHLQPPSAVAAALRRDDGRGGGVLVVAPVSAAGVVEPLAARLGLETKIWDN